ncbi:MAG: FRG domain-containing protein [Elusimicrobia bacterium]|nr:FRG domain-containing protein [Elusimicrobiota bacterium]
MKRKHFSIEEVKVTSITDFTRVVEQSVRNTKGNLWYRGCHMSNFPLIPSLYRLKNKTIKELLDIERKTIDHFKQRSGSYITKPFQNDADWEWLFFMQHYRMPTRLLDWTENPFVALYFSLFSEHHCGHLVEREKEDAAVWVLNPGDWNKSFIADRGYKSDVLSIDDPVVDGYKPKKDILANFPLAINGISNNHRIISQRGVFTVFGRGNKSFEEFADSGQKRKLLKKIILPGKWKKELAHALISIGYTDGVIFPDIEGLVIELKRKYGFLED